jgi:Flp pilus assembly protein TadD
MTIRGLAGSALAIGSAMTLAIAAVPAAAQGSYSPYNESASTALARYVRDLASNPQDFSTLIGAGRAAIQLGDAQAAAGFFARADEINPKSPSPHAGMGAVAVLNGEPLGALPYFKRAQELGAPLVSIACDRGLAYDLLGRQADAQADYRLALTGADAEEARRRLSLSLAISGKRDEALMTLSPLLSKGDAGAVRARAFILALSGDPAGARSAIEAAMPGNWVQVAPFIARLSSLKTGEKAAAVNLGIFPDSGAALALGDAAAPIGPAPTRTVAAATSLPVPAVKTTPPYGTAPTARPAVTQASLPKSVAQSPAVEHKPGRVWLQIAADSDPKALTAKFRSIKSSIPELMKGITPYMAQGSDKSRLVIGPFRGQSDADYFAEDLDSIGVKASRWTNSPSDRIVPLGS